MLQSDHKFQLRFQRLPSIVQLADPGQNTLQDLMEEVPVHVDVVHVVTSTLPVHLLEQRVILPDLLLVNHGASPRFLQQLPLMQQ